MLRLIACNTSDKVFNSKGTLFQRVSTIVQIDFLFDTGLVVLLRDDVDGELLASFEESLSL